MASIYLCLLRQTRRKIVQWPHFICGLSRETRTNSLTLSNIHQCVCSSSYGRAPQGCCTFPFHVVVTNKQTIILETTSPITSSSDSTDIDDIDSGGFSSSSSLSYVISVSLLLQQKFVKWLGVQSNYNSLAGSPWHAISDIHYN
jgi:hypothetical protein